MGQIKTLMIIQAKTLKTQTHTLSKPKWWIWALLTWGAWLGGGHLRTSALKTNSLPRDHSKQSLFGLNLLKIEFALSLLAVLYTTTRTATSPMNSTKRQWWQKTAERSPSWRGSRKIWFHRLVWVKTIKKSIRAKHPCLHTDFKAHKHIWTMTSQLRKLDLRRSMWMH